MLIRGRLPAFITWGRFQANRDRLAANRSRCESPRAPRQGPSLLGGLLRCGRCGQLIEHVSVVVDEASERVEVELRRIGGSVRAHTLGRPVARYDLQSDYPRLVERLRVLCAERLSSAAMAARLNAVSMDPNSYEVAEPELLRA